MKLDFWISKPLSKVNVETKSTFEICLLCIGQCFQKRLWSSSKPFLASGIYPNNISQTTPITKPARMSTPLFSLWHRRQRKLKWGNYLIMMVPEYIGWRLRAVVYCASQIYCWTWGGMGTFSGGSIDESDQTFVKMQIRSALNARCGNWKYRQWEE